MEESDLKPSRGLPDIFRPTNGTSLYRLSRGCRLVGETAPKKREQLQGAKGKWLEELTALPTGRSWYRPKVKMPGWGCIKRGRGNRVKIRGGVEKRSLPILREARKDLVLRPTAIQFVPANKILSFPRRKGGGTEVGRKERRTREESKERQIYTVT